MTLCVVLLILVVPPLLPELENEANLQQKSQSAWLIYCYMYVQGISATIH